ncbi:MAG: flagellar basal body P-ring formation chaperone FlgA [Myxococcota bacterium]|nr:flagellar basal body P-ring formation chaperone FlgA [Myxococcota bacterium]
MRHLTMFLFLTAFSSAFAGGRVQLNEQSTVQSSRIILGDIASISGLDKKRRARLSQLYIGKAPEIGQAKYMPLSFIERRIVDQIGSGLKIGGPRRVEIRRKGTTLRGTWLAQRLRAAIEKRLPYASERVAEIVIPRIPDCRVPEGSRVKVSFQPNEDFDGHALVGLAVYDDGKKVVSRRINVKIDLFTSVVGVSADLRRGQTLSGNVLISLRKPASQVPNDAVTRPELVIGADVRRRIQRGDVLRHSWIKIPPVISRGDRVRVIAKRGAIQLSTFGKALNDATQSAFVRVRNLESKKVITGRAERPGVVVMEF